MKKILFLFIMITVQSYATTMCATDDSVTLVLQPDVNGTSSSVSGQEWTVVFPYITLSGYAECGAGTSSACYCRITHPVISKPVNVQNISVCVNNSHASCAQTCANRIQINENNRAGIFSSIEN